MYQLVLSCTALFRTMFGFSCSSSSACPILYCVDSAALLYQLVPLLHCVDSAAPLYQLASVLHCVYSAAHLHLLILFCIVDSAAPLHQLAPLLHCVDSAAPLHLLALFCNELIQLLLCTSLSLSYIALFRPSFASVAPLHLLALTCIALIQLLLCISLHLSPAFKVSRTTNHSPVKHIKSPHHKPFSCQA